MGGGASWRQASPARAASSSALQGDREQVVELARGRPRQPAYPDRGGVPKAATIRASSGHCRLTAQGSFLVYRLNLPSADEATMLLSVDDFERMAERARGGPAGRPIVGVDLGGGRAWSAATAIWESGRVSALAIAPGIPNIDTQEDRGDSVRARHLWAACSPLAGCGWRRASGATAGGTL